MPQSVVIIALHFVLHRYWQYEEEGREADRRDGRTILRNAQDWSWATPCRRRRVMRNGGSWLPRQLWRPYGPWLGYVTGEGEGTDYSCVNVCDTYSSDNGPPCSRIVTDNSEKNIMDLFHHNLCTHCFLDCKQRKDSLSRADYDKTLKSFLLGFTFCNICNIFHRTGIIIIIHVLSLFSPAVLRPADKVRMVPLANLTSADSDKADFTGFEGRKISLNLITYNGVYYSFSILTERLRSCFYIHIPHNRGCLAFLMASSSILNEYTHGMNNMISNLAEINWGRHGQVY